MALFLVVAGCLLEPTILAAQEADPVVPVDLRILRLEKVTVSGATRTSHEAVVEHLPLQAGQPIDQATLVAAVEELRASRLFRQVEFYTRPGSARGQIILVLDVQEHGADFRWALGNTDLDGWYLVPIKMAWDNVSGRGDFLDAQWRFGFRHNGFLLNYGQPNLDGGRAYWGVRLGAISTDRPYYADGVEFQHRVNTIGAEAVLGHRLGDNWLGEVGLKLEGVNVFDYSQVVLASEDGTLEEDQKIRGDDLPAGIRDYVGEDGRMVVHLDLQHDTRSARRRAGTPVAGLWGRLRARGALQETRSHAGLRADLRRYAEVPGGVAALRLRGAVVTARAPFYDRLYLGGMYSLRGFPTHSLSAPGGDTWQWTSSMEYRTRILPDKRGGTRLAGVLFLDAGSSGTFDGDAFPGVSASAGYGVRVKVWWLGWLGVDVGIPLTERPNDHRFQVTASIGWSF
ncbi:MAG: BamA/TamA family outer membrane protein [bacterium]|nr:BamA/TamA family outer membrane protein [bacterium]